MSEPSNTTIFAATPRICLICKILLGLSGEHLKASGGSQSRVLDVGVEWWVSEQSGGHLRKVVGIRAEWIPVVFSRTDKDNNLHW